MTVKEARKIIHEFDDGARRPTDEDFFMFTEAMDFLINEEHNPEDVTYLGGVYYAMGEYDLALKYYEMAAMLDYEPVYEDMGYIWYYGRTGKVDYEKAYNCFSRIAEKGNIIAMIKIADMYKNGYYVEKDLKEYKKRMEEYYEESKHWSTKNDYYYQTPFPEIYTRLAHIRIEEGLKEEAINLLLESKNWMAHRIQSDPFFGNLNIMKWLIDDLYELIEFDEDYFDFFDLYYLLKTPHIVSFVYNGKNQLVESVMEGEECTVCFNNKWFRSRDDYFKEALVDGTNEKLTSVYRKLYGFEVIK